MKVNYLELTDIGGIPYFEYQKFNPQMNIICGENGVGKTNILDAISFIFSINDDNVINKRAGSNKGKIVFGVDSFNDAIYVNVEDFEPSKYTRNRYHTSYDIDRSQLIYLKVNRVFSYFYQDSIGFVGDVDSRTNFHTKGVDNKDLKEWFVHRVLLGNTPDALSESELENIKMAMQCFSVLDKNIEFKTVTKTNEIIVSTHTGDIYFEYLSSGFKSTLFILLGIIKELDYRFLDKHICYVDFDGIILIDEIELHLHPEWQGKICSILKKIFPNAQFLLTTHSPHVIQSALQDEVIALERKNNKVAIRDLPTSEYGYQGWTIEEILEDVMGMADLRTRTYKKIKAKFDKALDEMDKVTAQSAYCELDRMLHPQYPLRPVFKMQLESLGV
ncbi:AAA family ATPase [Acinetobacter baumannii]|nr:AAA family ATPase [Acinetobacter baumannii]HAV5770675.1 recombinase RecF [Acinetobacter baumannii]HCA5150038.1 AAA family ATPase [Acinetobacter baumannii]